MSNEVTLDSLPKGTVPLEIPPSGQFQLALEQAENVYNSAIDLNGEINTTKNTITNIQNDITNKQQLIESYKNDTEAKANEALASANLAKEYMENAFSATPTGYEQLIEKVDNQSSENVKQNDEIALLKRKVSAQEQINKDIAYRFETDDTEAYQKTVMSGAKAFDLKMLGGKSECFNQLIAKRTVSYNSNGLTYDTLSDGSIHIHGTTTGTSFLNYSDYFTELAGHTLLLRAINISGYTDTLQIRDGYQTTPSLLSTSAMARKYVAGNDQVVQLLVRDAGQTINCKVYIQWFDLTKMGLADISVEEFNQRYPANYYPFNAGEIISASVGNVKVESSNLFNFDEWAKIKNSVSATGVNGGSGISSFEIDYNNRSITLISNRTDAYTYYEITNNNFPSGAKIYGKQGEQFTLTADVESTGSNATFYLFEDGRTAIFVSKTYYYSLGVKQTISVSITLTKDTFITYRFGVAQANGTVKYSNIRINKGSVSLPYFPYKPPVTITIPNECTDLKSAGTVSDTVEFYEQDGKKYAKITKRVGSVDLGSLSYTKTSTSNETNKRFYGLINDSKPTGASTNKGNVLLAGYNNVSFSVLMAGNTDKCFAHHDTGYSIQIVNYQYNDYTVAQFKQAMQGVMLYYELAEPTETIIEIDNRFDSILCEANGTITFEGADSNYHLPVPNTEEYMVKLNEV